MKLTAPTDTNTPTVRLHHDRTEYAALATVGATRPVHLASAFRRTTHDVLIPGHATLCGKNTARMGKTHAAGRDVDCTACLALLDVLHDMDAQDARAVGAYHPRHARR